MMKHPAVHIALVIMIAAMLTLVARGCDGDHESELPPGPVADAPLPAEAEPAERAPREPPPVAAPAEEPSAKRMNPCLKLTPPAEPAVPLPALLPPAQPTGPDAAGKDAAAAGTPPPGGKALDPTPTPAPAVPPTEERPRERVNPCLKRTPTRPPAVSVAPSERGTAPDQAASPATAATLSGTRELAPAASAERPAAATPLANPCMKRIPSEGTTGAARAVPAKAPAETPPPAATTSPQPTSKHPPAASAAPPASAIPAGNPCMRRPPLPMYTGEMVVRDTPSAAPPAGEARPARRRAERTAPPATGDRRGPLLVSSLDDGGPDSRAPAPASPDTVSAPRLATSMDDGAPAATPSPAARFRPDPGTPPPAAAEPGAPDHQTQHARGIAHDHGDTATAGGGDERARHVARMKAGRHVDLSHVRLEPPDYPPPERYRPGKNLYEAHCHACHGDRATGTDKAPPLLHPYYDPNDHGDEYFYNAVANGAEQHLWDYGDMPALPHVSHDQVRAITGYVRWLQRQVNIY